MSLGNKKISSEDISNYILSKNILDKKSVSEALLLYKKSTEPKSSFEVFLVKKKFVHESTMQKIIEDLLGVTEKKEPKKDSSKKELLDQDVAEMKLQIEEQLKGKEKNLKSLLEPTENDVNNLLSPTGLDWQGRRMTAEDQDSLIKKVSTIKASDEVSKTNGVFVLSWMSDLFEP